MGSTRTPLVVAVVGTDHHPFERLVGWVDRWAADAPARVVIQYGAASPPTHARGESVLGVGELRELLGQASAVVCHGGPGTIATIRRAGLLPIVLARDPNLGEHVDDHQIRFVRRLSETGAVLAPSSEVELRNVLDRAVEEPSAFLVEAASDDPATEASARLRKLVDRLVDRPDPPARGRVLYIGGWGRSGSTLLDRMLGQIPGVFSAGELRDIWTRGVAENRLCGCGSAFRDCEVWGEVGKRGFGGWENLDVGAIQARRMRLDRPWTPPRLLASRLAPELDADVVAYVRTLERLYGAIREVTGAELIVDSSKIPTHAMLLHRARTIDLRVVHLVRDPRGVVFSWQKQVVRADGGGRDQMDRYGTGSASARYLYYNAMTHVLRAAVPYRFLRYEDLIRDARGELGRVLEFAGIQAPDQDLGFLHDGVAELEPNHTVDGNPMRLSTGPVELRLDEAWRHDMSPGSRRLVTAATAPLLAAYRYPLEARR